MAENLPVIAFVIPCYNEEQMLPISLPILLEVIDKMSSTGLASADSFILCCNDGSKDHTWQIISDMHRRDGRVKGISLAHNRGQQPTLMAGLMTVLNETKADAAITIDADLQDPPEAIYDMVRQFREGSDIVYGVRSARPSDTWFKRNSAGAFYSLQRSFGLDIIPEHSEFRLMDRRALELLSEYGEVNIFLRGIMPHIGLRSSIVTYERTERIAGETKFPLSKMVSTALDAITSFTAKPMRFIFLFGVLLLLIDVVVAVWVGVSHFTGKAISGWSSLMVSVWFLGSVVLIALGVIGEYVGKIYEEVKHRPRYAIEYKLLD